ncbi:MAG: tetratricopeptide repeat protein [bacterium]|nr:tetratricopeptide repeat protein [bacterium]
MSPKLIIVYIVVFVFLIFLLKTLVKPTSESERKLLLRLEKSPENIQYNFDLADYYYLNERYDAAIRYYKSGLALADETESNNHYTYKLGICYLNLNRPEAVEYLEKLYKSGYNEPDLKLNLAVAYKKQGNFYLKNLKEGRFGNYSQAQLSNIIKLYFVRAYEVFLSDSSLSEKNGDEIKYLEMRLLEIDKDFQFYFEFKKDSGYSEIPGLFYTATLYKDIKEFEKSKQIILGILKKESNDKNLRYECLHMLGWMFFDERQYSQALKYFKDARSESNTAKINYWIGKTYEQLGQKEEAIKYIKIALKMDPKYPDAIQKLKELQQ